MTHRIRLARTTAAGAVLAALALTGCSTGGAAAAGDAEPDVTITVTDMSYEPAEVTIHPGDTVEWVFDDGGIPHDVSGEGDLEGVLQSELLSTGSYTYTFDEAGTFTYHCTPHPMMVGTVVVEG
ncbi:plastocyanin/azurin family copper-binding protein [Agromyces sp. MMS24-K17]|uniref:plastocyanin/azurin family copper-binding protein n=1 Tax=Agromyces sp. MMS24-K17 TaxID=3372850 RepID=UPI00375418D7